MTNLRNVDLGFVPERLIVLNVNPQAAGYKGENAVCHHSASAGTDEDHARRHRRQLLRERRAVRARQQHRSDPARGISSRPRVIPARAWDVVGPKYFSTMGIPLVAGRDFTDRDNESSPQVIAINETMARRFFAGANPIGRRLVWGDHRV